MIETGEDLHGVAMATEGTFQAPARLDEPRGQIHERLPCAEELTGRVAFLAKPVDWRLVVHWDGGGWAMLPGRDGHCWPSPPQIRT